MLKEGAPWILQGDVDPDRTLRFYHLNSGKPLVWVVSVTWAKAPSPHDTAGA